MTCRLVSIAFDLSKFNAIFLNVSDSKIMLNVFQYVWKHKYQYDFFSSILNIEMSQVVEILPRGSQIAIYSA